jgi:hypothetical protein
MDETADNIFNRTTTAEGTAFGPGLVMKITPIDNLIILAGFSTKIGNTAETMSTLEDTLTYSQYAVGYTIPDLGFFRVGYFGRGNNQSFNNWNNNQVVQAAFRLDAVPGLLFDIGGGYSLDTEEFEIAFAGGYRAHEFNINGSWHIKNTRALPAGATVARGFDLILHPTYDLDFGTLGAEILVRILDFENIDPTFGVALTYEKIFSGGSFKTGVAINLHGDDPVIIVPLEFTYSIW